MHVHKAILRFPIKRHLHSVFQAANPARVPLFLPTLTKIKGVEDPFSKTLGILGWSKRRGPESHPTARHPR